ncbi:uncharacterized protein CPUR_08455 [Claviceps purpurea 20.1]|uniref:Helitron helicase-like domain-containing protein n=1 Tax=Claviceps purpurea (strain 20.1) TaxID=1111077 RepID=M1VZ17_CLAP2|nr:uncharacterized protein CPUR_08455 [Claviceps purpurea 20.1]
MNPSGSGLGEREVVHSQLRTSPTSWIGLASGTWYRPSVRLAHGADIHPFVCPPRTWLALCHEDTDKERLPQQAFHCLRLHERLAELEQSTPFLTNRLFQQYAIDAFIACETTRLDWITGHQENIRADLFVGLEDVLNRDDAVPENLIHRVILPSSFTGSDRHMRQLCQDSMAMEMVLNLRPVGMP